MQQKVKEQQSRLDEQRQELECWRLWWIEKEEWDESLHEAVEETVQPQAEESELEETNEKEPERESSEWWTRTVYKPCVCKSCSESFSPRDEDYSEV